MKVQKMALLGVLTAGAIVIAILESFIPSIGIPGVKLGLANIVILVILYELGIVEAIIVNLLRVIVVGLVRGTFLGMGFLMSLTGAVLSLTIMILFYLLIKKFSIIGVSVIGRFSSMDLSLPGSSLPGCSKVPRYSLTSSAVRSET